MKARTEFGDPATVREIDPPSREPPLLKLRRAMGYAEMVRRWRDKNAEID
jgi:hypothetical protein